MVGLYAKTDNLSYLEKAYYIAKNNVNNYVSKQKPLNEAYLDDLRLASADADATKDEKKEIDSYNKMLKEVRKKELPPVDATLLINIKLMLDLADTLDIDSDEASTINGIMHNKEESLFLVEAIDNNLWYGVDKTTKFNDCLINWQGKFYIEIPANYVNSASKINVIVEHNGKEKSYTDWAVESVDRHKSKNVNDFTVKYTSTQINKIELSDGDSIIVEIYPYEDLFAPMITTYKVNVKKKFIGSEITIKVE